MSPIAGTALIQGTPNSLSVIAAATLKLNGDAQRVANPSGVDDTAAMLDLKQALALVQAGANVIRAENKMLGALLDAFA